MIRIRVINNEEEEIPEGNSLEVDKRAITLPSSSYYENSDITDNLNIQSNTFWLLKKNRIWQQLDG